jgi:hypothetical protein
MASVAAVPAAAGVAPVVVIREVEGPAVPAERPFLVPPRVALPGPAGPVRPPAATRRGVAPAAPAPRVEVRIERIEVAVGKAEVAAPRAVPAAAPAATGLAEYLARRDGGRR